MQITLPVSNRTLEIPVLSYAKGKELSSLQRKFRVLVVTAENIDDATLKIEEISDLIDSLISPQVEGFEDLPHRDVLLLRRVTIDYNMGEPIAAIKNLLATGDGAPTSSEQTIAPTAKKSKSAKA